MEGTPTGITATRINAGEENGGFGSGSPFGVGGPNGGMGASAAAGSAFAQARGKITSVKPLTIFLSETVSVIVKAAPDLKIMETVTETLADLKIGDRVMAGGQSDASGILTADSLHINMGDAGIFPGPTSFPGPSGLTTALIPAHKNPPRCQGRRPSRSAFLFGLYG